MGFWLKRILSILGIIAVVAAIAIFGRDYWQTGRFRVSTDDAYVQADFTTVAPKVAGYISQVLVEDNQPVKAGQVLARIDDNDIRTALEQADAEVQATDAQLATIEAQIDRQGLVTQQSAAALSADRAARTFSQQELDRYAQLVASGAATLQRSQQARSDIVAKEAALSRDQAGLGAEIKQVDILKAEFLQAKAKLMRDQAVKHQAELNLSYTTITSAIDGTVGARAVRVGQYVQAGTQLMAVVPLQSIYVIGNFKETQLTNVRAGQPVDISIDAYPDLHIHGRVQSLAPASGAEFALLPADNATGNFTKVVQRIPVKIALDRDGVQSQLLRPGMSVEPRIDTRTTDADKAGAQLAEASNGEADHRTMPLH